MLKAGAYRSLGLNGCSRNFWNSQDAACVLAYWPEQRGSNRGTPSVRGRSRVFLDVRNLMKRTFITAFSFLALSSIFGCGGSGGIGAIIFADLLTSFEPADFTLGSTDFTKGTAPDSVHFTGGTTGTAGLGHLYKTGIASWGVFGPSTVATADLDKAASVVELYAANQSTGTGLIEVFDESDALIASSPVTVTNMMLPGARKVFIAADLGAAGIGKVTVTNGAGGGDATWIDDFTVTYPTP